MKVTHRSFFQRPAVELARALIGMTLVRALPGRELQGRIVETEAYLGPCDLASHASKGRTRRTEVLFGPPGYAYVYLIYGMHTMLNVVAGAPGEAQAVLIRAAEPLGDWKVDLSGPGRLARAFQITRSENGIDLTGDQLYFLKDSSYRPRLTAAKRVGIDYAKEWKDVPLRFLDADRVARTSTMRSGAPALTDVSLWHSNSRIHSGATPPKPVFRLRLECCPP